MGISALMPIYNWMRRLPADDRTLARVADFMLDFEFDAWRNAQSNASGRLSPRTPRIVTSHALHELLASESAPSEARQLAFLMGDTEDQGPNPFAPSWRRPQSLIYAAGLHAPNEAAGLELLRDKKFQSARPTRMARLAHTFLRIGKYPKPFHYIYWTTKNGALLWSANPVEKTVATPFALSFENVDLGRSCAELADAEHGLARRAYTIIELAHEVRWLALALHQRAHRFRKLAPRSSEKASLLLSIRSSEFAAASEEWLGRAAMRLHIAGERDKKLHAFREVSAINQARSDAASQWRPMAEAKHDEVRRVRPNATLRSIVLQIVPEIHGEGFEGASEKAVYNHLYRRQIELARGESKG